MIGSLPKLAIFQPLIISDTEHYREGNDVQPGTCPATSRNYVCDLRIRFLRTRFFLDPWIAAAPLVVQRKNGTLS